MNYVMRQRYNEATGDFEYEYTLPVIHSFRVANPAELYVGDIAILNWNVEDITQLLINGEPCEGNERKVSLERAGNHEFLLRARNWFGVAERKLSVNVLPRPTFDIQASATVLHKGQNERTTIRWNVENAMRLVIRQNNAAMGDFPLAGELMLSPTEDTSLDFVAVGLDGQRAFHRIEVIAIRNAAQVEFRADRHFSYPNLPIRLSWDIADAISVELEGYGPMPASGALTVTPGVDTTYVLKVGDAFGERRHTLCVRMLPLPAIKEILVPTPRIEKDLAIKYCPPQFNAMASVPTFESPLSKIQIPRIPVLGESSFFVPERHHKKSRKFSMKSLLTYFFNKQHTQS